ncbi:ribosome-associated translation inhibitor RaiA [Erythrobacter sp. LQ02-29]|uniref:ribosome hibernation-promoting factor, HPF/YfiA family n=1 Tax=unclassified Erythrobacter TaxID=2633097 RepID=UPI001BFC49A7|nr:MULTISPECIES: ribosome-associated translation inhibitor RaiA [unclassified Erythrobacter]MCP9221848.1 ribosome-associated translation inhibitor RaiA [Erythrobacter sp. LQ02-29]QWC56792.1 ribosome-associated translation inhibitor RaiA [Erythrobacter sp. 3-20A1M]
MDIRVSGHQIDTGSALQDHATDRLNAIVEKYFTQALSSHVTFGKAGSAISCDIVAHVMHGLVIKAHGEAHDAHQALDQATAKLDKQLRRYKRRLQDRHTQASHTQAEEEAAYRIFAANEAENDDEDEAADAPLVVAETKTDVPEASVADAVMMLDLRDTAALFFKNAGTGRHNMVYRRRDGTIGWVEPH